ncbi:CHAD domain-containing protein [Agromyces sp. Marseille-P2726]|uniref:CHAD domain-containing protein n=1 Tax=Agromyces sp. Marseille-P2726 TaxID=2709132 RepID=UPI00156F16F2|nr:CHAD domain-containing protein [Agromyces sp. Marseille-P2726]
MVDEADLDAGTAVVTALRAVADRMWELEPAARADEPDAVHQLRTHVRRIRSLLGAYAPVFDAAPTIALRRRFGALGDELGVVRDIEVRVQVAERALEAAVRDGLVEDDEQLEAVKTRLIDAERRAYRLTHARFVERQGLPRAAARRVELASFLDDPPFAPVASRPGRKVLRKLIRKEARRTLKRADRLDGGGDTDRLHEVRKAGRRLRYAAEAVTTEPVELFGTRIAALADVGDDLHDLLGDHRDEVLFAEHVRRAAARAAHEGGAALVFERLAAEADARAAAHLGDLPDVVKTLRSLAD